MSLSEEKLTHLLCNDFPSFSRRRNGKIKQTCRVLNTKTFSNSCLHDEREKPNNLSATTMFTYYHANTPLGQSERAYYLSYFIKLYLRVYLHNLKTHELQYLPSLQNVVMKIRENKSGVCFLYQFWFFFWIISTKGNFPI